MLQVVIKANKGHMMCKNVQNASFNVGVHNM